MIMDKGDIDKKDLFNVVKYGKQWHIENIRAEAERFMLSESFGYYDLEYLDNMGCYYMYENQCHLKIFDKRIEVSSDRENVLSSDQTIVFEIEDQFDIADAFKRFRSMTMEDAEE